MVQALASVGGKLFLNICICTEEDKVNQPPVPHQRELLWFATFLSVEGKKKSATHDQMSGLKAGGLISKVFSSFHLARATLLPSWAQLSGGHFRQEKMDISAGKGV